MSFILIVELMVIPIFSSHISGIFLLIWKEFTAADQWQKFLFYTFVPVMLFMLTCAFLRFDFFSFIFISLILLFFRFFFCFSLLLHFAFFNMEFLEDELEASNLEFIIFTKWRPCLTWTSPILINCNKLPMASFWYLYV